MARTLRTRDRRLAAVLALVAGISMLGSGRAVAGGGVTPNINANPNTISGVVLNADGTPSPGASVALYVEKVSNDFPDPTIGGTFIGNAVTDSTGHWTIVEEGIDPAQDIVNPDGSVIIDAEVNSADGTLNKAFNFNIMPPTSTAGPTLPAVTDTEFASGAPGSTATQMRLPLDGVDATSVPGPTPGSPAQTNYATDADAFAAAEADAEAQDVTIAAAVASGGTISSAATIKRSCNKLGTKCWVTGDYGPCSRPKENFSPPQWNWVKGSGTSVVRSRWLPVQLFLTKNNAVEQFSYENTLQTQASAAYTFLGELNKVGYKGGLRYLKEQKSGISGGTTAGHNLKGFAQVNWAFRKQRQWCYHTEANPNDISLPPISVYRDTGKRRWAPETFLGGIRTQPNDALTAFKCNLDYDTTVGTGSWVTITKTSTVRWSGWFDIAGIALDSYQSDTVNHQLQIKGQGGNARVCPNEAKSIAYSTWVREE